jgi:hypothetical protein
MSNPFIEFWYVPSHSDPSKTYKVSRRQNGDYACSCPHWKFRHPTDGCKHIKGVMLGGAVAIQVQNPAIIKILGALGLICEEIDSGVRTPPDFDGLWKTARGVKPSLTPVEWGRLEGELVATEGFWRKKYG